MHFDHLPLHPNFGVEIAGADISRPLTDGQFAEIRGAFESHSVLLFKGPKIDDARQLAFSARFGTVQVSFSGNQTGGTQFSRQSNIDSDTGALMPLDHKQMRYQRSNRLWHSDSSYRPTGSLCSILSALETPPTGGNTEFAGMRAAWDALPDSLKDKATGRVAHHSIAYSRGLTAENTLSEAQLREMPGANQALVQENPVNRRKSLFIGAHASHIEGWPVEEGRAFLGDLLVRATVPSNVYSHAWEPGDVIVWDNRCMLHRATEFDAVHHRRLMQRTTIAGEASLQ